MKRKCEVCPAEVQAVCRYAFGKLWNGKSNCGEGCDAPLDAVAEAWYAAGWTPEAKARGDMVIIDDRPERPTVSMTQLKMPRRPKVSARIAKQAELFFRGSK